MKTKMNCLRDKNFIYPLAVLAGSLVVFGILWLIKPFMHETIEYTNYLSIHALLEFLSVLFAFSIFTLIFYVYTDNADLRFTIIAATFFISGWIDIFHTLSYKGMPVFFTPSSAPKATAFWVIARLIMSIGFLMSILVNRNKMYKSSRYALTFWCAAAAFLVFYTVTYMPHLIPVFYIDGQGLTSIKIYSEYVIIILQGITVFLYIREYVSTENRTCLSFATALILSIFSELCFTLYISVYDLYNFTGHIYKILSYMVMFNILFVHNVTLPYKKLKEAKLQLKGHAQRLEKEVAKAREKILESSKKLYTDIEYARVIQQSMLPKQKLLFDGIECHSALIPCQTLSGDFFNIFEIDNDNIGVYIVDVSGHGVSSSIMTIFTDRTILSNKVVVYKQQLLLSPSGMLQDLFEIYNGLDFPSEMYLLIFYGVYNKKSRDFTYSSAGLNTQPFLISNSTVKPLKTSNVFPICNIGEYYRPTYIDTKITLEPDDKILFYSDGLIESKNRQGMEFTSERLYDILRRNCSSDAKEVFYEVFDRFTCFVLDEELNDDVTFFLMNVK